MPKAELESWQTAIGCLLGAVEGRDFLMHARIGMLRALNRNVERVFKLDRKEKHWGKRKLKRDLRRRFPRVRHEADIEARPEE